MPRKKTSNGIFEKYKKNLPRNFQQSYASFILGAIVVVILGLLVANFFTKRSEIGDGVSTEQDQMLQDATKSAALSSQDYVVAEGDSLSAISQKLYGNMDLWPAIARENNIANPNIIGVSQKLKVPAKTAAENMIAAMTQTTYKVNEGDTLFTIAEKMYGDGSAWIRIDKANNVGRLPNGNPLIFAGNTLTIPR